MIKEISKKEGKKEQNEKGRLKEEGTSKEIIIRKVRRINYIWGRSEEKGRDD